MYLLREAEGARVQLLGSGTILREVEAAAELLRDDFGVAADVWSCPSFTELAREGMAVERRNRLTGSSDPSYVGSLLDGRPGPVIAASDYIRAFPNQIRPYVKAPFTVLGTDGYGRSDWRRALRRFFEVDRFHVAHAALVALGEAKLAAQAVERYEIDTTAEAPWRR
jgi:pyruvate dehydrogenase E1 component